MFEFETVDVFTDRRFGGNPLAVFTNAIGLSDREMQSLAAELNLSEATFVLPPLDPSNAARVRIFNRTAEMAFAGHPCIGTAFVLARRGRAVEGKLTLETRAGTVPVTIELDQDKRPIGGILEAPQPLTIGTKVSAGVIAECVGVSIADVVTATHEPIVASVGNPYVIAELKPDALRHCEPNIAAFRSALIAHPEMNGRFSVHVYAPQGGVVRARMFAPLAGTWEDPATGSANAPLVGLLLSLGNRARLKLEVRQGEEMGRPSFLMVEAERRGSDIRTTVAGQCVPMFSGAFELTRLND